MKTTIYCVLLSLAVGSFIWNEYKTNAVYVGYTKETRARMDDLIANLTPLSVADLGVDAENFMGE